MYRHLLVATDGSPVSERAERAAVQIARKLRARITAIHVIAPYSPQAVAEIAHARPAPLSREEYQSAAEQRADTILRRVTALAREALVTAVRLTVTDADTGQALVRTARDAGCDLIVMGTKSRKGLERIFAGSVSSDVLGGTDIATLICH
jgi:nucleotide-binding universal stress UspA family protein